MLLLKKVSNLNYAVPLEWVDRAPQTKNPMAGKAVG